MRILLVEDDDNFAEALTEALVKQGFAVDRTRTLALTLETLQQAKYRLVLLDRQLPDGDGAEIVGDIRSIHGDLPILILTAKHQVADKVEGLDAGADDYLAKPFEMVELMARIRALIRRPARATPSISLGQLRFDFDSKQAWVNDVELKLPRRQVLVLEALCLRQGRTVRRHALEQAVYGLTDHVESNALESHISRLRKVLIDAGVEIHTMRGIGYCLKESSPNE